MVYTPASFNSISFSWQTESFRKYLVLLRDEFISCTAKLNVEWRLCRFLCYFNLGFTKDYFFQKRNCNCFLKQQQKLLGTDEYKLIRTSWNRDRCRLRVKNWNDSRCIFLLSGIIFHQSEIKHRYLARLLLGVRAFKKNLSGEGFMEVLSTTVDRGQESKSPKCFLPKMFLKILSYTEGLLSKCSSKWS